MNNSTRVQPKPLKRFMPNPNTTLFSEQIYLCILRHFPTIDIQLSYDIVHQIMKLDTPVLVRMLNESEYFLEEFYKAKDCCRLLTAVKKYAAELEAEEAKKAAGEMHGNFSYVVNRQFRWQQ